MRAVLFGLMLAVQHAAVDAQAYRDCVGFQKNQNSGPSDMPCPYYKGPAEIGQSSTNWGLKILRNDLAAASDYGYTFTNDNFYDLHFQIEFINLGLGLEWRSYILPGNYYCSSTTPGVITRYQLTC